MMLLVGIAVGVLLSGTVAFGALRTRRHKHPINLIEGVALPHPADSDWLDEGDCVRHGNVRVYRDSLVKHLGRNVCVAVGTVELRKGRAVNRYRKAVFKESRERQMRLAVEEPDSPLLVGEVKPPRNELAVQDMYANTGMDKIKVRSRLEDVRTQAKNLANAVKPGEKQVSLTFFAHALNGDRYLGRQFFDLHVGSGTVINIGRAPSSDLILDYPSVTYSHAVVEVDAYNVAHVRDLGAGTWVNGTRIRLRKAHLNPGDRITVGGIGLLFEMVDFVEGRGWPSVNLDTFVSSTARDMLLGTQMEKLEKLFLQGSKDDVSKQELTETMNVVAEFSRFLGFGPQK